MIDWIATHHEVILHTCVIMIALIGAGAMTYVFWRWIMEEKQLRREHNKLMAEYRRSIRRYVEDPDDEEVIRRII